MRRPHEATFTSGPYGHGSRVYAKVVETVIARLEKRLAAGEGEQAAAAAASLAGKVDKAWRETYKRSLPSEEKVKQELKNLAPTGVRLFPSEAGSEPVGLMPGSTTATMGLNHLAAASSGLWQTAGAKPRPYVRKKPKQLPTEEEAAAAVAAAAEAARRRKRRFVLKVAVAREGRGSGTGSYPAKKKRRGPGDVAADAARKFGNAVVGRRRDGVGAAGEGALAARGQPLTGGLGGGASAPGVVGTVANAGDASGSSSLAGGGVEGRDGRGGSGVGGEEHGRMEKLEAAAQERAGDQGLEGTAGGGGGRGKSSGREPREGGGKEGEDEDAGDDDDDDDDDDFSLKPRRRPSTFSSSPPPTVAAAGAAAGALAGADVPKGEGGGGRKSADTASKTDPATATANKGPQAAAAEGGGESNYLAGNAVPDVVVTANYVGDFLKNRNRLTWRLYLEGGVIEGKDQLFVFDECECLLDPPQW